MFPELVGCLCFNHFLLAPSQVYRKAGNKSCMVLLILLNNSQGGSSCNHNPPPNLERNSANFIIYYMVTDKYLTSRRERTFLFSVITFLHIMISESVNP